MIIRNTDDSHKLDLRKEFESEFLNDDSQVSNQPLLTIFAVPKPFAGQVDLIQRNAIRSWARLSPLVDVLLIGNEPGIKEAAEEFGVRHSADLRRNQFGTPLLSSAFETAHAQSNAPILVYCNCDLILLDCFVDSIKRIAGSDLKEFVAFGRRIDLMVTEELEFECLSAIDSLLDNCRDRGRLSSIVCKDFFAFSRHLYRGLPDFAVGRGNWDNWMIHAAKNRMRVPVINISRSTTVIHQSHDYSHVSNSRMSCYVTGLEARQNQRLAGGRYLINGSTATWQMDHRGLRKVKLNHLNLSFWGDVPRFLRLLLGLALDRQFGNAESHIPVK